MEVCSSLDVLKTEIQQEKSFALYFSDGICSVAESIYPKLEEVFQSKFPEIPLKSVTGPMSPDIQGHVQVFSAPCLLIFIDGKETIRKAGNFSIEQLKSDLERLYTLRFS